MREREKIGADDAHQAPPIAAPEVFAQPAAPTAGWVLAMQRSAGNVATARVLSRFPTPATPAAVAPGERAQIDKALGPGGTANDAKDITGFGAASDPEKVKLITLLMTDWWVGPSGEAAIERCWASVPDERFPAFVAANRKLWDESIERGAELTKIKPYTNLETAFKADVLASAHSHLDKNAGVVRREMERFGIPEKEGAPAADPTKEQAEELAGLTTAAKSIEALQKSQEKTRDTVVGWRVGDASEQEPDAHGKVRYKVVFDPKGKPPMDPAADPALPAADHWGPVVPYEILKDAYDRVSKSIAKLAASSPSLYALARQDKSSATGAVADAPDPKAAREALGKAHRLLAADIVETKGKLGGTIDPLDLVPVHEQLFGGAAPAGGTRWQSGFAQEVAKAEVSEHKVNQQLLDLLLQSGVQLAFLLAPLTGGATLVAIMVAATAATGAKAFVSAEQYEALEKASKTAATPGTQLVDDQTVDRAKMTAEADSAAFALTALATVGAIAEALPAKQGGPGDLLEINPQRRNLRLQNPKRVAEYEQLVTEKLPSVVDDVLAKERGTPGRTRLAELRTQFDQLRAEAGNAETLTEAQTNRANAILDEARDLARKDFDGFRDKVNTRLRADPQLKAIEDELTASGDFNDNTTGAVQIRTENAEGAIGHTPANIEHRTRLSDNPWMAKDRQNLLLTDAAQNQQYLEAIRKYGGVWPVNEIEDFVVRHQLNRQGIDFRPGPR